MNNEIVIIGAGNVATHLCLGLIKAGYKVVQIFSRTKESAKTLADKSGATFSTDLNSLYKNASVYLYAIKDSELEKLISSIKIPEALHIHTAGSISMNIFKPYTPNFGVLYPFQTLSKNKEIDFKEVPLFCEGNNAENVEIIKTIATKLSNHTYNITSEQRKKLHLAGVFACNFTNCMYQIAGEIVESTGLPFEILKPLIAETAEKIKFLNPKEAQTGPAVRYDINIIEKHTNELNESPDLQEIYKLLSKQIHKFSSEE